MLDDTTILLSSRFHGNDLYDYVCKRYDNSLIILNVLESSTLFFPTCITLYAMTRSCPPSYTPPSSVRYHCLAA